MKPRDLSCYDSPLVGFGGKVVIPMSHIRLPVQARSEVVEVNFIVVDASFPYTAIMARPWFHVMGAVSSTLHLKVKYSSGDQVEELVRSQSMARQCLVAVIRHQTGGESSASAEQGLYQSRMLVLSTDVVIEGAKCKELEKIIVGDDEEKFFQVGVQLSP